ncbi:MAG: hypothetical protein HKM95_15210 [Inquilinus sp.]|nr:hypothetical protein [Inquilinus sp.]
MGKDKRRFVAKAPSGEGWRMWDNTLGKWWGQPHAACPDALLDELNGPKHPDRLTALQRTTPGIRANRK